MQAANTSTAVEQAGLPATRHYALKSDLAQFCLPAATRDANRKLAYVNSICLFFLIVGIAGMRNPVEFKKELPPLQEFMPVEIYVPPVQQQTLTEPKPDEPPPPDTVVEMPQIATVVAADPSQVKFAVPVEGPVILAPAQFAQAPPPEVKAPERVNVKFTGTDGGVYPDPGYPSWARRQGQVLEASVLLTISVKPDGSIISVDVKKSSGSSRLVAFAVEWVKGKYRFPPITENIIRMYEKPFEFSL